MTIDHIIRILNPSVLGAIYGLSEIALLMSRHSRTRGKKSQDRHSLGLLWLVIFAAIFAAFWASSAFPAATLPQRRLLSLIGIIIFACGIGLRWWAIIVLGKFFTVDVAIDDQHQLVDSGPYRFVRHPSYTGVLVAFLGFGLCLSNWMSILCLMVPITAAFLWRIRIEERALLGGLGEDYRAYMQRTNRLVPFLL